MLERIKAHDVKSNRQLAIRVLSIADLDALVDARAATFLDQELVSGSLRTLRDAGFGRELHEALTRRQEWQVEQGLARKQDGRVFYSKNLMTTLADREISKKGAQIAKEHGGTFRIPNGASTFPAATEALPSL